MHQADIHQTLDQYFGFSAFRAGQAQTIEQLIGGQSSLAIFPTGSGKSLCYQLTALHLPNLTLVVSPLLALMQDQIEFLNKKGIPAASLDSTQTYEQSQSVMQGVRDGHIKILMVSVERFKNERFRGFIKQVPISMLVVDEAHCISEWGHNFRPDYLKLPQIRNELNIPLVLLLTATATKKVKRDMAHRFAIDEQHIVQTGFYRANLDLSIQGCTESEKLPTILSFLSQTQDSGIIYVTLQQTAEDVAKQLQAAGQDAVAYHAGLKDDVRQQIQQQFMHNEKRIIVATIAFGMGIDKSDIRFVIHYDLPKSIENYSQEIGRAGRDGQPSKCITLANLDGVSTLENFVYADTPELGNIESLLDEIRSSMSQGLWEMQELSVSKATNIRLLALKTALVQLELFGVLEAKYAFYADFRFKWLHPENKVLSSFDANRQAFIQQLVSNTDFKKVWGTVDMAALVNQGLERGRVVAALDYLHEQGMILLESKRMMQVYQVDETALNAPELANKLSDYFSDKELGEVKRIAAMLRFFELQNCLSNNLARYFDDQQVPQSCGHCSVCRGSSAQLQFSQEPLFPDDQQLRDDINGLKNYLNQAGIEATAAVLVRFLTGMTTPMSTANKFRQRAGFGSCSALRYKQVESKLSQLGLV
ncbi:ATP-dependent DNA helicase RecQ [Pseudoalteromonas luteoviolacea]|uniref:ATP-dependent DNA helicase RecQ n=1 Tax=Pseudoalteromonas luteoviolacea TaxID=43657 RepID=A0A0C1MMF2_9GAMM|nr:RecQ family ATP-dependent DNA helicase [Pseudoalteromonas luteoviolacea]KID55638.1 ATP-dependent DNA helicase RecQ [Pseudoalteromonas luteoviolacea]